MKSKRVVRLARQAESDIVDILRWSATQFGARQAEIYAETLSLAITALMDGPDVSGAKSRDDIDVGIHTLHVARLGRKGRHFVVFRVGNDQVIDVLRVLHDRMDLVRHIPSSDDQSH